MIFDNVMLAVIIVAWAAGCYMVYKGWRWRKENVLPRPNGHVRRPGSIPEYPK